MTPGEHARTKGLSTAMKWLIGLTVLGLIDVGAYLWWQNARRTADAPQRNVATPAFTATVAAPGTHYRLPSGWAQFDAARSSQLADDIVLGLTAQEDCAAYTAAELNTLESRIRTLAAADAKNAERRVDAARAIVYRCQGFATHRIAAGEITALWRRAAQLGQPEALARAFDLDHLGRTTTPAERAAIQASLCSLIKGAAAQPAALSRSAARLAEFPRSQLFGFPAAALRDWDVAGAIEVAACKLGKPCGPHTVALAHQCATAGRCDAASEIELVLDSVPPHMRVKTAQLADKMAAAVKARNCSGFF